jgi:hypothetical protein
MSLVVKGDFSEFVSESPIELGVFGTDTQYHEVSGFDTKGALELTVQVTNGIVNPVTGAITEGDSSNVTATFYGDIGMGYATVPLGQMNLGSNTSDIWFGIVGHYKLKIIFNNTDPSYPSKVTYKVVVKK